ncbi:MAG: beta-lactamase family protein, partial [Chloroflexi bacterium]
MTGSELQVEVEAGEVGFEAARLARIPGHFDGYVEDGRLPGWLALVTRFGRVVHLSCGGHRDLEAGRPVEIDTRWRIYSMTKPVTSVAAMMLYEEGRLQLTDPVARYIPSFRETRVYSKGSSLNPLTVPMAEPMRVWHLLTHTAGLTYGFHHAHPVDAMYRAAGFEW